VVNAFSTSNDYDRVKLYLKNLGPIKKNYSDRSNLLINRYLNGDLDAFNKLILENQYIVIKTVISLSKEPFSVMDLIQAGNISLINSLEKSKIKRNDFKSFLSRNVYRGLMNQILKDHSIIRIPQNQLEKIKNFNKYYAEPLYDSLGIVYYSITGKNNINTIKNDLSHNYNDFLDSNIYKSFSSMLYNRYDRFDPDLILNNYSVKEEKKQEINKSLNKILNTLKKRERDIIILYYGLNKNDMHTLNEIGINYNITRERARQIKENALLKLRHPVRKYKLMKIFDEISIAEYNKNFDSSVNQPLLDPSKNFYFNKKESINLLKEYVLQTTRKEFVPGVKNLAKHYRNIITSFLSELGHITLSSKVIKHIKNLDNSMFNKSIYEYVVTKSDNIQRKNEYVGLKKYF
jgi:RNA polymerase primary sigma factor